MLRAFHTCPVFIFFRFFIFFLSLFPLSGSVREFSSNAGNICIRVSKPDETLSVYMWYGCKCMYGTRLREKAGAEMNECLCRFLVASTMAGVWQNCHCDALSKIVTKPSRWQLIVLTCHCFWNCEFVGAFSLPQCFFKKHGGVWWTRL